MEPLTTTNAWIPLSIRRQLSKEVDALIDDYVGTPVHIVAPIVRDKVTEILGEWGERGQKFVLQNPGLLPEALTFDGAVSYLTAFLRAMESRPHRFKDSFSQPSDDTGRKQYDVAADAAIRLAHIVAPVAARLIADGGENIRECFNTELDRLLSIRFEGPIRQSADVSAGLSSQGCDHLSQGGFGVPRGNDGGQECLDSFDRFSPSSNGVRVSPESQPPRLFEELGGSILRPGSEREDVDHVGGDALHEEGAAWGDSELVASPVEGASQMLRSDVRVDTMCPGVTEEPVQDVEVLDVVAQGKNSQQILHGVPASQGVDFSEELVAGQSQVQGERQKGSDVELDASSEPQLECRTKEAWDPGDGLIGQSLPSPHGQRNPRGVTHDSSIVDREVTPTAPAPSTCSSSEPIWLAHLTESFTNKAEVGPA